MKLTSAFVMLTLLSSTAMADTMTYDATVGSTSTCTIMNVQNGTLVSQGAAMVSTTATGGQAGYFSANASAPTFRVAALGDVIGAGLYAPQNGDAKVMDLKYSPDDGTTASTGSINGEDAVYLNQPSGSVNYTVDLTLMFASAPANGTYSVTHSIVCVPQ